MVNLGNLMNLRRLVRFLLGDFTKFLKLPKFPACRPIAEAITSD